MSLGLVTRGYVCEVKQIQVQVGDIIPSVIVSPPSIEGVVISPLAVVTTIAAPTPSVTIKSSEESAKVLIDDPSIIIKPGNN